MDLVLTATPAPSVGADLRSHRTPLGLHKVASNDVWITAGVCRFKPNYFTGKAVYATIDADSIWFSFII